LRDSVNYREPSLRDDYTIKNGSWVRFAHHKHPELEGLKVWTSGKRNGLWALHYGSLHGVIFHEEKDLVPA